MVRHKKKSDPAVTKRKRERKKESKAYNIFKNLNNNLGYRESNTQHNNKQFLRDWQHDNAEWEGQNTHCKRERVKIPRLPYSVDKRSVNDSGPTVGSRL